MHEWINVLRCLNHYDMEEARNDIRPITKNHLARGNVTYACFFDLLLRELDREMATRQLLFDTRHGNVNKYPPM
jgi:hypothetical protein